MMENESQVEQTPLTAEQERLRDECNEFMTKVIQEKWVDEDGRLTCPLSREELERLYDGFDDYVSKLNQEAPRDGMSHHRMQMARKCSRAAKRPLPWEEWRTQNLPLDGLREVGENEFGKIVIGNPFMHARYFWGSQCTAFFDEAGIAAFVMHASRLHCLPARYFLRDRLPADCEQQGSEV